MKLQFVSLMLVFLSGCAYPTSSTRIPDDRPSIAIQGAPSDAVLYVDGLAMGSAQRYNGQESALLVEPGTHRIEVRIKSKVLHQEKIFLGGGEQKTITIIVPGEAP